VGSTASRVPDDDGPVQERSTSASGPRTSRVRLGRDEVHLEWGRTDARGSLDSLSSWLSDDERRRSERFRSERDARAFVVRRAFLRATLARFSGRAPGELAFVLGPFGKPSLVDAGGLAFSASSAGERVLVAVTNGRELGVDVERLAALPRDAEELSRLAARVLTAGERAELARCAPAERAAAFLRAWTRKEALLKALGTGLSREPDTVEVGLGAHAPERALASPLFASGRAWLGDLDAPPGFAASLVVALHAGERVRLCVRAPSDGEEPAPRFRCAS